MTDSNHKRQRFENPVGGEFPLQKLDIPLWQVFVALFLIAGVLTLFKVYERNRIAPQKKVPWKPFEVAEFQQEQRQRRNLLLWIHSDDDAENREALDSFDQVPVRVANYMGRCLNYQLEPGWQSGDGASNEASNETANPELLKWIDRNVKPIRNGGIAFWAGGSRQPTFLESSRWTPEKIAQLIEGT